MAPFFNFFIIILPLLSPVTFGQQLSSDEKFYHRSCPNLHGIVRSTMARAISKEPRMGASVLRLFFHDCFVNGCDASVLLDDTATFTGEKNAFPNQFSLRGFEIIDAIKDRAGAEVSCADILALAARDAVVLLGGPTWTVQLGRRDATTASQSAANRQLPPPFADLPTLISAFADKGLDARDMTALSGAHTIGKAQCAAFRAHVYNDTDINTNFAAEMRKDCPPTGGSGNLSPLDHGSEDRFDNGYYKNLVARRGLLHSDQELFNGGSQDTLVRTYSDSPETFADDFASAMVKLGALSPLTGNSGEIRSNCRVVNS